MRIQRAMILFGFAVASSCAVTARGEEPPLPHCACAAPTPTLRAAGHGRVTARPDQAIVRLGIQAENKEAAEAQTTANDVMQKVVGRIKGLGIFEDEIQTVRVELTPVYASEPRERDTARRIELFRASNLIEVRVKDLDKVGHVIDAAMAAGANRLEGVSFSLEKEEEHRNRALRLAASDARARANVLAEALHVRIADVSSISTQGANTFRPEADMRTMSMAATPVQPGELEVHANIEIEFRISGNRPVPGPAAQRRIGTGE